MASKTTARGAAAIVMLFGAACTQNPAAHDQSRYAYSKIAPPNEPTAIGGGPRTTPVEVATDDIAEARCDREARCGNVGGERKFVDRTDCLSRLAREIVDELDSSRCPDGINGTLLNTCTQAARSESCESAARQCDAANLCRYDNAHG